MVPATVATLMVDAEQSERLAIAASQGKILLTLRSLTDTEVVVTKGVTTTTLLAGVSEAHASPPAKDAAPKPARRHAPKVAAAPPPPPPKASEVVEIMRGDVFERRDFQKDAKR
ncbi:MAG TPA: hypothetical protein VFP19_04310 [Candidatus Limnocylindrales bacterium]|nr:hypothetical protein [Candidatus Limnocylindrales bacterium]